MKWEDLKVYTPLAKEELKNAFKAFTKSIADNLAPLGFRLNGRMIQRISQDVIQTIHIDTRGSWTGVSEHYTIAISIMPYCNTIFIHDELSGIVNIEEIVPNIRNHTRITLEHPLLADFITRQIVAYVLPYFEQYRSTLEIAQNLRQFPTGNFSKRNEAVVIFTALKNHNKAVANEEIKKVMHHWNNSLSSLTKYFSTYLNDLNFFYDKLSENDWESIDQKLKVDEEAVLKKLKFHR
ncbi:hypothetical protein [Pseudochryseolinea flava]|uniref:DUF4304 domain-containing protein n=1 Tax=Pseudochryseolinea flava TaxID=2059302 RepID=A0A364XU69_9BACT|nr:hypothetical protein [Pseudochryseolinea flava]RAV97799.1 hypothetical protein DQQ10_26875 [Pseudochryseolinea flava]